MNRRLSLRREVLSELSDSDLRAVAGGETTQQLSFSCLTVVSCFPLQCVTRYPTLCRECVQTEHLSVPC